jgi:hypothetical protein
MVDLVVETGNKLEPFLFYRASSEEEIIKHKHHHFLPLLCVLEKQQHAHKSPITERPRRYLVIIQHRALVEKSTCPIYQILHHFFWPARNPKVKANEKWTGLQDTVSWPEEGRGYPIAS